MSSADVNAYLKEISGRDITSKHFRTWAATVLAALALAEFAAVDSAAAAKRNIKAAIDAVAARLGNTPTICRKCYVHPEIVNAYLDGNQLATLQQNVITELEASVDLEPAEAAILGLLSRRLSRKLREENRARVDRAQAAPARRTRKRRALAQERVSPKVQIADSAKKRRCRSGRDDADFKQSTAGA